MYFFNTYPEIMSLQTSSLIFCLLLTYVSHSQGLHLSMTRTPGNVYCGHLQCLIDINQTDSRISSLIGLNVFNITQTDVVVKLASVLVFAPDPYVEQTKLQVINATGSVSRYNAYLALSFKAETDCLYGSFVCELDFMNVSGQPDVIREVVTPGSNGNCPTIMNQLLEMVGQIKTQSDDTNNLIKTQSDDTNKQLTELRTEILGELSGIKKLLNLSLATAQVNTTQKSCVRGMTSSQPREKFLLWGPIMALCDTETDGGGWIVIQRRTKGDVEFYRAWNNYKNGFGTPDTDFWIGNDIIYNLTSQGYTDLRIDLEYGGTQHFAHYSNFTISDELSNYKLTLGKYDGTAEDGFTFHNGSPFSTYDRDSSNNCVTMYHGAWWYNNCYRSNLNGLWAVQDRNGIVWYPDSNFYYPTFTEMKIRRA